MSSTATDISLDVEETRDGTCGEKHMQLVVSLAVTSQPDL